MVECLDPMSFDAFVSIFSSIPSCVGATPFARQLKEE
jgi:hypothetical protein